MSLCVCCWNRILCCLRCAASGFGSPHFNFANGVQVDVKTMRAILVLVVTTESLKIILRVSFF